MVRCFSMAEWLRGVRTGNIRASLPWSCEVSTGGIAVGKAALPRLSTEASEFSEGLGRELWVRELLRVHHLFQQRIAELRRGSVGIYLVCGVVLCLFERYQLQMLRLQHVQELRQDR